MRSRIKALVLVVASLLVAAFSTASATAAPVTSPFAAQGISAGLTTEQVSVLQHLVDRYMARAGGRQTSLNTVDLQGAQFAAALPGEERPRALSTEPAAAAGPCDGGTAPGWFCAYSSTYGRGSQLRMYNCGTYDLPGWTGLGSWGDNQTTGLKSYILDQQHDVRDVVIAKSSNQSYNWTPIWYITPC